MTFGLRLSNACKTSTTTAMSVGRWALEKEVEEMVLNQVAAWYSKESSAICGGSYLLNDVAILNSTESIAMRHGDSRPSDGPQRSTGSQNIGVSAHLKDALARVRSPLKPRCLAGLSYRQVAIGPLLLWFAVLLGHFSSWSFDFLPVPLWFGASPVLSPTLEDPAPLLVRH